MEQIDVAGNEALCRKLIEEFYAKAYCAMELAATKDQLLEELGSAHECLSARNNHPRPSPSRTARSAVCSGTYRPAIALREASSILP
jgi:hypothetical protein